MRFAALLTLSVTAWGLAGCASQRPAIEAAAPTAEAPAISLVPQFDAAAMRIAALPEDKRFDAYERDIVPLLPGIYKPGARATPEKYRAHVLTQLAAYPEQRGKILAVANAFDARLASSGDRFRKFFPDYRATLRTYLIHSLGQMDGGTREFDGQVNLVFGADMIAKIHDADTIGPLFDHELFHAYHNTYFAECEQVWCSLWAEGLAVYVTSRMNPGIDDKGLLLTFPKPIRPEVDAHFSEAVASVHAVLDSTDGGDYARLFNGGSGDGATKFPSRYGYYVGYRAVQQLAGKRTLEQLAKMPPADVRKLLEKALTDLEKQ